MASATSSLTKAVIATGGKQYLVAIGSEITVEKLVASAGDKITLDSVIMAADAKNNILTSQELVKASVNAEVLEQGKGKKIRVSTFKSKKRQHRTLGHRQLFTRLRITAINAA
jgi:large subunit ribosomal protein L21